MLHTAAAARRKHCHNFSHHSIRIPNFLQHAFQLLLLQSVQTPDPCGILLVLLSCSAQHCCTCMQHNTVHPIALDCIMRRHPACAPELPAIALLAMHATQHNTNYHMRCTASHAGRCGAAA